MSSTCFTHGPAAFTSARAATSVVVPSPACERHAPQAVVARAPPVERACARGRRRRGACASSRIDHHQPRVVDARVGVDEALAKARLQPGAPAAARRGRRRTTAAASCGRPGGRRGTGRRGSSTPDAGAARAAARTPAARRCAARMRSSTSRSASASAPAGTRSARGSAARRGSAWCSTATWPTRDRPARPAAPTGRGRRRRARCRRR